MSSVRRSAASSLAFAILALLAAAPGARGAPAPVELPAAGQLAWPRVAVQAKPDSSSRRIAVLGEFLPDFRRRVVLALDVVTDNAGSAAWYRISLPGRPNGRSGWVRDAVALADMKMAADRVFSSAVAARPRLPRTRGGSCFGRCRPRSAHRGNGTPLGTFCVCGLVRADRSVPRRLRVLHERLRAAERLARRRRRRHPRTSMPWLLGHAVSHGCIRVANRAMLVLKRYVGLQHARPRPALIATERLGGRGTARSQVRSLPRRTARRRRTSRGAFGARRGRPPAAFPAASPGGTPCARSAVGTSRRPRGASSTRRPSPCRGSSRRGRRGRCGPSPPGTRTPGEASHSTTIRPAPRPAGGSRASARCAGRPEASSHGRRSSGSTSLTAGGPSFLAGNPHGPGTPGKRNLSGSRPGCGPRLAHLIVFRRDQHRRRHVFGPEQRTRSHRRLPTLDVEQRCVDDPRVDHVQPDPRSASCGATERTNPTSAAWSARRAGRSPSPSAPRATPSRRSSRPASRGTAAARRRRRRRR